MVSSSKLRKAEKTIENLYPYSQRMNGLLKNFLSAEEVHTSIYSEIRSAEKVAIVTFSSNSSLCGSFNANVIRKTLQLADNQKLDCKNVNIYPVGKKVRQSISKSAYCSLLNFDSMADKPSYPAAAALADELMEKFRNKEIDKVEMVYFHFNNKSSQILTTETLLPVQIQKPAKGEVQSDYIIEPDHKTIMEELIPRVLRLKLYTALLDSNASEHAARMMAMQIATDNADDLLQELSLLYNKSRQQAITNELLDIIGGSFK